MTTVFATAMILLALAVPAAWLRARAGLTLSSVGALALVVAGVAAALGHGQPVLELGDWFGFGRASLRADGVAGIFLALTGVTGGAVSLSYLQAPPSRGIAALHAAVVALVAVAVGADQGFWFFGAWEGITVCLYLLASADTARPGNLAAGYLTGGLTKLGGAALLAAFALLYAHTGTFHIAAWAHAGLSSGTRDALFLLFLVAFGTKVGVLPLQGALPVGYGAAPRAGAATLSVALAAGFYGLWRFVVEVLAPAPAWWGDVALILGAVTALAGIAYAITQDDLRRFLGFSTVEHTGIALLGLGVALAGSSVHNRTLEAAGLLAATLHVVAHGLAKTLALVSVDGVEQATGRRTMDVQGGLVRRVPVTALALGLASLTLAAVPPLGGFVSEWFTFEALLQGFRLPTVLDRLLCALGAAALALTAGLGLLAFAKLLGFTVLGPARDAVHGVVERAWGAIGPVALGVLVLVLGAAAPWEIHLLGHGLSPILGTDPAGATITHPLTLGPVFADFAVLAPTWLYLALPAYTVIALVIVRVVNRRPARRAAVWITGSGADLTAVQYRPSSYVNPIRVVLRGPLGYRSRLREADDPLAPLRLETRVVLAIDRFVYRPVTSLALGAGSRFRRLQSGRLGDYLLYMLAVLIVILALVPALR